MGGISGSHPTDQARAGLGASRFDPGRERLQEALRQIVLLAENYRQFSDREIWQEMEREARAALKGDK